MSPALRRARFPDDFPGGPDWGRRRAWEALGLRDRQTHPMVRVDVFSVPDARAAVAGVLPCSEGRRAFRGRNGTTDLVLLVIRSRSGSGAIVAASPPVTRIG